LRLTLSPFGFWFWALLTQTLKYDGPHARMLETILRMNIQFSARVA
jgi:hypothetical protein